METRVESSDRRIIRLHKTTLCIRNEPILVARTTPRFDVEGSTGNVLSSTWGGIDDDLAQSLSLRHRISVRSGEDHDSEDLSGKASVFSRKMMREMIQHSLSPQFMTPFVLQDRAITHLLTLFLEAGQHTAERERERLEASRAWTDENLTETAGRPGRLSLNDLAPPVQISIRVLCELVKTITVNHDENFVSSVLPLGMKVLNQLPPMSLFDNGKVWHIVSRLVNQLH